MILLTANFVLLGMRTLITPLQFSTALHWCTENRNGNCNIIHYFDAFLLGGGGADTLQCDETLTTFRDICNLWGVPLAEEKP